MKVREAASVGVFVVSARGKERERERGEMYTTFVVRALGMFT